MMMFVVQHLICRRSRWLYFFLFLSFRVYRERRSSWWLLLFFSLCIKKKKNALDVSFHGFSTPPAFVWCRQAKKGWAEERLWCPQHLPAGGKLFTFFFVFTHANPRASLLWRCTAFLSFLFSSFSSYPSDLVATIRYSLSCYQMDYIYLYIYTTASTPVRKRPWTTKLLQHEKQLKQ